MSESRCNVAIVGATGAVGIELLELLEQRKALQYDSLRLFASERSAGKKRTVRGEELTIEALRGGCFEGVDIAIFSAGGGISREWAPKARDAGAIVVDNSSAFRMDEASPLIVPEINGDDLTDLAGPTIIANPNCSTIIALLVVAPLHRAKRVKRVVISTYQAASGAGAAAMRELEDQAGDYASKRDLRTDIFGRPYIFNLFSHDSAIGDNGYNTEEMKMVRETHKILSDSSIGVSATCVRVPVLRAHCESINVTFEEPITEDEARKILSEAPGVTVVDDRKTNQFPEPRLATGVDEVLVGRIRSDISQPDGRGLDMFVAGDQLRKGAALNALQIAEFVAERLRARADTVASA